MLSKHNIIAFFMSNDTRLVIAQIAMAFYILNFYEDRIALIIKEKTLCEQFCVLWGAWRKRRHVYFCVKTLKASKKFEFFHLANRSV